MLPLVFGIAGTFLSKDERSLIEKYRPFGVMLFARNCVDSRQIRELTASIRGIREYPPLIWIDQEGGRVQRLGPPGFRQYPCAGYFGDLYAKHPDRAVAACEQNAFEMASQLADLGISVNCAPVLDLPTPDSDPIIGERAFSGDPMVTVALGQAVINGHRRARVIPVIKHIPGHGRAQCDSHQALPRINTSATELQRSDFVPFARLRKKAPAAMVAHVVLACVDEDNPASCSSTVINDVIRGEMGFEGLLVSDAIDMGALYGDYSDRAVRVMRSGCDLVLHCTGVFSHTLAVADNLCRWLSVHSTDYNNKTIAHYERLVAYNQTAV